MKFRNVYRVFALILLVFSVLIASCQANQATPTLEPTVTATVTATPAPTLTASPTKTPLPTDTPEPTATTPPTSTHSPAPTQTPKPSKTFKPTAVPATASEKATAEPTSVSGVSENKPESILAQSNLVMTQVETVKFKMDITSKIGDEKITITAEGHSQTPDKMYMKMSFLEQNIEMLMLSATETYMRMSDSEEWEAIPPEQFKSSGTSTNVLGQAKIDDVVSDLSLAGIETVNGEKCYRIDYTMDMEKYFKKMVLESGQPTPGFDPETTSAVGTIWISVSDLLTCQYELVMDMEIQGQKMTTTTSIEFYDYNKPVQFPKP